ncbi:MAG: TlpA disulfide reductase family protein [Mucinivorans sp.]
MKHFSILSLLALAAIVSSCAKTATISLSYNDKDTSVFYIGRPMAGAPTILTDTICLAGDTTFTQTIQVSDHQSYFISNRAQDAYSRVNVVVAPNEKIALNFVRDTVGKGHFLISEKSTSYKGQKLYDGLMAAQDPYKYEWVRDYSASPADTVGTKMYENFTAQMTADLVPFQKLQKDGDIDQAFLDFVKQDITYYNVLAMAKVIRGKWWGTVRDSTATIYPGYSELWQLLTTQYPINSRSISSQYTYPYGEIVALYGKYMADPTIKFDAPKDESASMAWSVAAYQKAFPDPTLQEPMLANLIYGTAINNKNHSMVVDTLIMTFNKNFEGSQYSKYFARFLNESKDYQTKINRPFSDKTIFVADTESLTTLTKVFEQFKGKPLFVDFWFTTCGSCREEMKHATATHKFLEDNGITALYISIDRPQNEQNWKNAIKYENLEGYHVRADKALHTDMYEKHGIMYYPTYMIVDAQGNIVDKAAPMPSSGEKLYNTIREKLKLK